MKDYLWNCTEAWSGTCLYPAVLLVMWLPLGLAVIFDACLRRRKVAKRG